MEKIIELLNKYDRPKTDIVLYLWLALMTLWVGGIYVEQERQSVPIGVVEKSLTLRG